MPQETELVSMLLLTNDLELQTVMAKPVVTANIVTGKQIGRASCRERV